MVRPRSICDDVRPYPSLFLERAVSIRSRLPIQPGVDNPQDAQSTGTTQLRAAITQIQRFGFGVMSPAVSLADHHTPVRICRLDGGCAVARLRG
jgi:hypothetical protein